MTRSLLVRLLPLLIAALPSCWGWERVDKQFVSCEPTPDTGCVSADVVRSRDKTCGDPSITAVEGPREIDGKCCYLMTVSDLVYGEGSYDCTFAK